MSSPLLRQSLPLVVLAGLMQLGSGTLLGVLVGPFKDRPELLVIVPALLGLKGSVEVALGSRLGSALHLGLWGPGRFWNRELAQNLAAALILTLVGSMMVGLLGYALAYQGGQSDIGLPVFLALALVAGMGAGTSLMGVTVGVVWLTHHRGLDPDNVTAPMLTTAGDMLGLFWLLIAVALFFGGVG